MERKRILVLANSYKHHARCIAGRELNADGSFGPWIRPVSDHGEGELLPQEMQLTTGREAKVRHYISVPLSRYADNPLQPENWLIDGTSKWLDADKGCPPYNFATLAESPPHLWHQPGGTSDSVFHHRLQAAPPPQSLYVIQPENFRVRVEMGEEKARYRAIFDYRGIGYNFSITDPEFLRKNNAWFCSKPLPLESTLPCGDHCLLCISLGSLWQGKHYKIVATIFENVP